MLKRLTLVLTLIVLGLLASAFHTAFEFYEEDKNLGWSKQARANPFLALELYSQQQDQEVLVTDSYLDIKDIDSYRFIYINNSQIFASQKRVNSLLDWVAQGGHLLIGVSKATPNRNRLLNELNITLDSHFEDAPITHNDEIEPSANKTLTQKPLNHASTSSNSSNSSNSSTVLDAKDSIAKTEKDIPDNEILQLPLEQAHRTIEVRIDPEVHILHTSSNNLGKERLITLQANNAANSFIQLEYQTGLISLLASSTTFESKNIALLDHAFLWDWLSHSQKAIVLFGSNMPSLKKILFNIMPELLLAAGLLTIAIIWHFIGYFGPKKSFAVTSRRAFHEHLSASAGFFWKNKWQQELLQPLRDDLYYTATHNINGFSQASRDERSFLLSNKMGIDTQQINDALHQKNEFSHEGFILAVQILQQLRRGL